jgi:hypothetical protein
MKLPCSVPDRVSPRATGTARLLPLELREHRSYLSLRVVTLDDLRERHDR